MQVKIEELKKSFGEALASANSAEALEALRVEYLGKKGHVAELMTQLRFAEDKKAAGQLINGLKVYCEGEIERATEELRAAALDIAPDGGLLVRYESGITEKLTAGEISIAVG